MRLIHDSYESRKSNNRIVMVEKSLLKFESTIHVLFPLARILRK